MALLERCDSLAVLTEHELPEYITTDSEGEGTSSGYDSASDGLSDNDANNQVQDFLLRVPEICKSSKNQTREKMNFQNTNALCDHLKYIMSMPDLCDVRFLVGEEKIPIYGVKAIMATRSRTFYHLIIKHRKKQEMDKNKKRNKKRSSPKHLTIDVKKYDADVFRKIIQFVHCGSVDLTMENVAGLLCGSCQFGLEDLTSACWDFIDRCVKTDSFHQILVAARQYSQHRIITILLNKINQKLASLKDRRKQKSRDTVV